MRKKRQLDGSKGTLGWCWSYFWIKYGQHSSYQLEYRESASRQKYHFDRLPGCINTIGLSKGKWTLGSWRRRGSKGRRWRWRAWTFNQKDKVIIFWHIYLDCPFLLMGDSISHSHYTTLWDVLTPHLWCLALCYTPALGPPTVKNNNRAWNRELVSCLALFGMVINIFILPPCHLH